MKEKKTCNDSRFKNESENLYIFCNILLYINEKGSRYPIPTPENVSELPFNIMEISCDEFLGGWLLREVLETKTE